MNIQPTLLEKNNYAYNKQITIRPQKIAFKSIESEAIDQFTNSMKKTLGKSDLKEILIKPEV